MKMKSLLFNCCLLGTLTVLNTQIANAQMSGANAFLKGNYVEIGISGVGGHEGATSTPPAGCHFRGIGGLFGFVANPQMNGWVSYDGDFYTPGSPENGWGFEYDNPSGVGTFKEASNASGGFYNGNITSWAHTASVTTVDWQSTSTTSPLKFDINYSLGDNDLYYITTVTVTNASSVTIKNIYYYRNVDPDNNQTLSGSFSTTNTIINQPTACFSCYARVSAEQSTPWASYFEFLAVDSNFMAGYGGFSNRDGSDMYIGTGFTQTVGASNFDDEAIFLAYKVDSLVAGGSFKSATSTGESSRVFRFATVFKSSASAQAIAALNTLTTVGVKEINGEKSKVSIYPNPFTDNATVSLNKELILTNASMHIYDVMGKEVKAMNVTSQQFTIDNSSLSTGMYFFKLINNNKQIGTGKLIIK